MTTPNYGLDLIGDGDVPWGARMRNNLTLIDSSLYSESVTRGSADAARVLASRAITSGTGLTGGGDLTADRTIALANMAANSLKGNNTGSPAAPIDLTATQAKALLAIAESDVTNLVSDLAAKASTARQVLAGTGLAGGGDLTADHTLSLATIATGSVLANTSGSTVAPTATAISTTLKTALSLVKADVGLGSVDNTSDATKFTNTALTGTTTVANVTASGRVVVSPDALADAATIAVDASLGNQFRVTLGGNRTLGNPTNPADGQRILFELIQDATGSRTITLDTKYALGTDISSVVLTTTANKRDFLGVVYNLVVDKWFVIAFAKGY